MSDVRRRPVGNWRFAAALVALLVGAVASAMASERPAANGDDETEPPLAFDDEITVRLISLPVRVVDSRGEPLRDLGPGDFRVRSRGEEVPVVAVDWVSAWNGRAHDVPAHEVEGRQTDGAPGPPPTAPGNRVIFFVQADHNSIRIRGHLRMLHYAGELLDTFHPSDRAAVVSFDSHLKLWQGLTGDLGAVRQALERAVRFGGQSPRSEAGELVLDAAAARAVATPEAALRLTAEALQPIPGPKSLVFLGWGLGRYGFDGVSLGTNYRRAVDALHAAGTSVFVLDVTDADLHTLEVGLRSVAAATGGTYAKTNRFALQAVMRLGRILSGYYLLSVRAGETVATDALQVELRDRSATILLLPRAAG